jgi:putative hydrolase of the HAD superfamily
MTRAASFPDWDRIDIVLLDLDGTLLDLAFDNRIWLIEVPSRYAAAQGLSIEQAQAALAPKFRHWRGRLEWYCLDFWSRETGLDLEALHHEFADQIRWLPGARDFLLELRRRGKRAVLCTNSHPTTLAIKQERTGVLDLLDAAYSSHPFGAPKEDAAFWSALQARESFVPQRALFVDDSPSVLAGAQRAGIGSLVRITQPATTGNGGHYDREPADFATPVRGVADLLS